ncbi:MAG: sigma 54-dependent Fis family transcriptional regulator [Deltaproteobacteria bacterium]|nr:sigma 54-dependent Fis family transcriptional regulator [Deltaproteobacteria bacterium]
MKRDAEPTSTLETVDRLPLGLAFRLAILEGPDAGAPGLVVEPTTPERVLVGTSGVCKLVLRDRYVSRRHLGIDALGDRLRISDLGSANGTFVNGVRIYDAALTGGELVRLGQSALRVEPVAASAGALAQGPTSFGRAIGRSPIMRSLFRVASEVAKSDLPVVIEGETGAGKDILAESIHEASARRAGPFVVFDGSTISSSLVDVTLFGAEPGAVAGVPEGRAGLLELARGGTLLLDEPALVDLEVQRKLVRALERREIVRVGGTTPLRVDFRVLVTSSVDLDAAIEQGRLRDDLFYRIATTRLEVPPLRRRRDDIAPLARHFWQALGGSDDVPPELLSRLEAYDWPGNVRELENAVAAHLVTGELAPVRGRSPSWPPAAPDARASRPPPPARDVLTEIVESNLAFPKARQRVIAEFERAYVAMLLTKHGGNVTRAAAASGIGHRYFQMLKARHGQP